MDTDFSIANHFARCSKCKSIVKDTDVVLDAVRIGQEALDKAEGLQNSSEISLLTVYGHLFNYLGRSSKVDSADDEAHSYPDWGGTCASSPSPTSAIST